MGNKRTSLTSYPYSYFYGYWRGLLLILFAKVLPTTCSVKISLRCHAFFLYSSPKGTQEANFNTMKHLILVLCLCGSILCGCTSVNESWKKLYDIKEVKYIPVKKDGHYLYINSDGEEVIPAKFDYADIFRNGLALVKDTAADLYGYINTKGDYQIEPKYKSATVFSNDVAWVAEPDSGLKVIDKKGKTLFMLPEAEMVSVYSEGIATFRNSLNKWGCVDKKGKILIEPKYKNSVIFLNGKAVAETDKGVMVIDKKEKTLIGAGEYQYISPGETGSTCYIVNIDGNYGLVNEKNKFIINPQYDDLFFDGEDLLVFKNDKGKYGWCDLKGNVVIKPKYESASGFRNEKLSSYSIAKDKYGFIDKKGKIKINAKYDNASYFHEGKAFVEKDGKWGIINEDGDIIAEPQFEYILPHIGKVLFAKIGGKYGIIDDKGKFIANPEYDNIAEGCLGSALVFAENNHFNIKSFADFAKSWVEQLSPDVTLETLMEKYSLTTTSIPKYDPIPLKRYHNRFAKVYSDAIVPHVWSSTRYRRAILNKEASLYSYQLHIELVQEKKDKGMEILKEIRNTLGMDENASMADIGQWSFLVDDTNTTDEHFSIIIAAMPRSNTTD